MKSTQYEKQFRNPLSRKGKTDGSTVHDEPDFEPSSTQTHIEDEDEEEVPQLSVGMTIGLLVVVTVVCPVSLARVYASH